MKVKVTNISNHRIMLPDGTDLAPHSSQKVDATYLPDLKRLVAKGLITVAADDLVGESNLTGYRPSFYHVLAKLDEEPAAPEPGVYLIGDALKRFYLNQWIVARPEPGSTAYVESDGSLWMFNGHDWLCLVEGTPLAGPSFPWARAAVAGGWTGVGDNVTTNVDVLDFATEAHAGRFALRSRRYALANFSSSNYGYLLGGSSGAGFLSSVERLTYEGSAYDSMMICPLDLQGGTQSTTHGYTVQGNTNGSPRSCVQRYDFSLGGFIHIGNALTSRLEVFSVASSVQCYTCGGGRSDVERFTFPFDGGTVVASSQIRNAVRIYTGFQSSVHGFVVTSSTVVERFTFPFDAGTTTVVGAGLDRDWRTGAGFNSSTRGYVAGGVGRVSHIDRVTFPFDVGPPVRLSAQLSVGTVYSSTPEIP